MIQATYSIKAGLHLLFGRMQTESETDQRMLGELQAQLVRLLIPMALVNILNSLVVAFAYTDVRGAYVAYAWAGLICMFATMQIVKGRQLSKRFSPTHSKGSMLRRAEWTSCLLGLLWGMTSFLFASESHLENMFLNIVVVGMGAGTAAMLGPLCRLSARFIVCSVPLVFAANIYTDFPFALETGALVTALVLALVIGASRNAFHFREMVRREVYARRAETDLNSAINASNDAFALYGANGELVLANARHNGLYDSSVSRDYFGSVTAETRAVRHKDHWLLRSVRDVETGGTVVVHTDVTTMKTRERELVEARREAEEADEAKGRFLSTMSHELRQPLHVIIGNATLMSSGSLVDLSRAEVQDYADDIHQSGEHLLRLIDDIIDYSKVGLGRFMLKPDRMDLRAMIAKAVQLAANFEGVKDLSVLDVSVSPRLRDLHVDEFVCQRILISLLSNAFRFGGPDPRLTIKARLDDSGRPYVSIRDYGPGISDTDLERVFEPFYQKDDSLSRDASGAGLGLTLCRHLARLHDGDVVLNSRLGAGTNATLILPQASYVAPDLNTAEKLVEKSA